MAAAGVQPVAGQAGPAEPARAVLGQQWAGPDRRQQRGHLAGIHAARGHRAGPRCGQRPRLREQVMVGEHEPVFHGGEAEYVPVEAF